MKYYGNIEVRGDWSIIGIAEDYGEPEDTINPLNPAVPHRRELLYSGFVTWGEVDETVSIGQGLYLRFHRMKTSQRWLLALANSSATMPCRGIALEDGVRGRRIPILRFGSCYNPRGNYRASNLYISDTTRGLITSDIPTKINSIVQCIGFAKGYKVGFFDFNHGTVQIG